MRTESDNKFRSDIAEIGRLILGMRAAYTRGENAMAYARQIAGALRNSRVSALFAYDLQSGLVYPVLREIPTLRAERWNRGFKN